MAAKEIEVSTQPNIKVNLENHEATHNTCTEEKKTTKRALVDRGNAASFSSLVSGEDEEVRFGWR